MKQILRCCSMLVLPTMLGLLFLCSTLSTGASKMAATSTVTINGGITFQTIDGFGASGAFRAASHIHGSTGLSADQQQSVVDLLFNPMAGAGLSIWRLEIGSSSTAGNGGPDDGDSVPSIAPKDPGGADAVLTYFWDGVDADQVWLAKQAQRYGVTQFYATAWGAPAYMKTNQSLKDGGNLCGTMDQPCANGDWRRPFAQYLVQYLKYYQAAGIDLTYLGFQNEPDLSPGYTGMNWDATHVSGDRGQIDPQTPQNIDFIKNYLGPALADSGLKTRIACCDATSWERAITYANGILADAITRENIGLITGHGYYASTAGMLGPHPIDSAIKAGKPVWQSEAAIFNTWNAAWDGGDSESSGIHWAEALWDAQVNTQVNAYLYWWGAKAYQVGGKTANSPLIKIVGNTYEPSKRLWAFASYSRFVRPKATRLDAQASDDILKVSAFKNADGGYAIVVLNKDTQDRLVSFTLQNMSAASKAGMYLTNETNDVAPQPDLGISDGAFTSTLPARSLVTYVIAGGKN